MQFLKRNKRVWLICLCAYLLLSLWGCGGAEQETAETFALGASEPQLKITTADRDTEGEEPIRIVLEDHKDSVYIRQGGTYLVTGTLEGCIYIDAEEQIVHVIMHDAEVDSTVGPALHVQSAGKVILTLAEDTVNTLQDSGVYEQTAEADACIYSECDLTINGSGMLNVYGYYKDAVHTKDVLKVLDGTLFVQSKRDGLRGNDGILLSCREAVVQSERNGLRTTKVGKPGKGNIEILAGEHSVIGGNYAVLCAQDLYARDCKLHLIGVVGDVDVKGARYVQEGCLSDE